MSKSYSEFSGAIPCTILLSDDLPMFELALGASGNQNEVNSRILMSLERTNLKLLELS